MNHQSKAVKHNYPKSKVCPVCQRFTGPANTCPYCDTDIIQPLSIRVLRRSALLLGITGLAITFFTATRKEPTLTRIGSITPLMNFAQVKIAGTIDKDPYTGENNGTVDYISFPVRDESGQLLVTAHDGVSKSIASSDRPPRKGDRIEASGSLNVSANGKIKLRVQSVNQMKYFPEDNKP